MFIFLGKLRFEPDRNSLFFPGHTLWVFIYRSHSRSVTEFDDFLVNLEKLLKHARQLKSWFLVILGDFSARYKLWWWEDITSHEDPKTESLTISYGLQKLISDPTHLLPNSSSCINLIFMDQPNLTVDSGVHPSYIPLNSIL